MTKYIRLPTYAYTIVLGVCRAYEVWHAGRAPHAIQQEMMDAVDAAAARVMYGEERAILPMIHAIAVRAPYGRASPEIIMAYSESTFNRRKNRLINAIARELDIL